MKKNKNRYLQFCLTSIIVSGVSSNILAATTTDVLTVNAQTAGGAGSPAYQEAASSCTLGEITDITFPPLDSETTDSANIVQQGHIKAQCPDGQSYTIVMDRGLHYNHSNKVEVNSSYTNAMATSEASPRSPVAYFLSTVTYISSVSLFWQNPQIFTGNGSLQTHPIYAIIQKAAFTTPHIIKGDVISDTVNVTLTIN